MRFSSSPIFALVFLAVSGVSFVDPGSQNDPCKFLLATLKNREITAIFGLDKQPGVPIRIIDVKGQFAGCILGELYNRKISVVSDTQKPRPKTVSDILVNDLVKVGKKYRLYLQYQITGASGYVELIDRKRRAIVSKTDIGHF